MAAEAPRPARGLAAAALGRLAREPLVQFFAVATTLFAVNSMIHGPERARPGDPIVVSQGRVRQIAESYRLVGGRPPSKAELQALVDDYIDEEVAYREAVAMGLDTDDTIVRRRMRQKLDFLVEDARASREPSERDLQAFLQSHASDYRFPPRVGFRQVLLSADVRGPAAAADAKKLLVSLEAGADPGAAGDGSMLPRVVPLTTEKGVAQLFGDDFAARTFAHAGDGWFGPVASPYGAHLVRVTVREPGRTPALDEVRDKVRSDWIEARRAAAKQAFESKLRKRYAIEVRWPEPYASERLPAEQGR